jgi:osmotically-inducible protein OsmY
MAPAELSDVREDPNTKHGAIGHLSADEEKQQAVCKALIEDTELDSSGIRVRVTRDTVVLSGQVPSAEMLQRALQVAKSQRGVDSVEADELRVSDA